MKITSVDIIKTFATPSKAAEIAVGSVPWHPICVRINTDSGICGYGEIGVAYGNAQEAGFGMGVDLAKCIIGMDPLDSEAIWNKLHRMTFWGMGNGGVIMAGISGIDIALWDIKGKVFNAPVYKLMGGKTNSKLRAYASQLQFDWGKEAHALVTPEEYAQAARKAMADGFTAIKVDPIGFDMNGTWMGWTSRGIGMRHITNDQHPVETMEDLAGLKIRVQNNNLHMALFEEMGASPTPIAFSELFTALQQGTVDGQENPISNIFEQNYAEVQKYFTISNHLYTAAATVVNEEWYQSLPQDVRDAIDEACVVAQEQSAQDLLNCESQMLEYLGTHMEVTELSPEATEEFRALAENTYDLAGEIMGEDYWNEARTTIENVISGT